MTLGEFFDRFLGADRLPTIRDTRPGYFGALVAKRGGVVGERWFRQHPGAKFVTAPK